MRRIGNFVARQIAKIMQIKFFHRGLGINKKRDSLIELIDQRRLDGTKTKTADKALAGASSFLSRTKQPEREFGINYNKSNFTIEQIIKERKKLGKK